MMKKILLLGGSAQQIVAIETAKRLGYSTIVCDFLPDNPGQFVADKFYLESTTNVEAILNIAKKEKIDGIVAYASDPAAPTAAYVAEQLGLPTNPYSSVKILCNKDLFRKFLSENSFWTPKSKGYDSVDRAVTEIEEFQFPVIVKPVDSSGSKGVSKIRCASEAREKINYAMTFSRAKRIIIEEYVEQYGYQIAGDGLVVDGKLVFRCFGNDHFDEKCVNPFVPIAASFPYNMPEEIHIKIHKEIQRLLTLLDMKTGTYNFDIRIDKNCNVYLMEIAPRDGGNYIPQIIEYATGVNLVEYAIKGAMGEKIEFHKVPETKGFWSYYAVHSLRNGKLIKIEIKDWAKKHIVENYIIAQEGEEIKEFSGANSTLGILLMKFDSMNQMLDMMDNSEQWIEVII